MGKTNKIFKKALCLVLIATLLSSVLSLGVFAATNTYSGPKITGVTLSETRSQITLNFNREIESATSNFRGRIFLSQGGKELEALAYDAQISISGYRMYITLPAPLETSDNFFLIASGTLVNQTIDIESDLFDARGPQLAATDSVIANSTAKTVTIKFKNAIKGYPSDEALKNGYISLARNGTSFDEIIPAKDITLNKSRGEIVIRLSDWISGNKAKIKISAGKLASSNTGNINLNDIITPAIQVTNTSNSSSGSTYDDEEDYYEAPQLDYTTISDDRKTVTIYFTDRIKNAFAPGVSASIAASFLKSYVWVSRGSKNNFQLLGGTDSIAVGSNFVKITFADPLIKSINHIRIDANSLTDYNGKAITENIVTDNVTASTQSSSTAPKFASASLLSDDEIAVYFTIPVNRNSELSLSEFRSSIYIARNGYTYEKISSYDSVSFSGNTMFIQLQTPLKGNNNRLKILADAVVSKVGVPLETTVITDALTYDENYYGDDYDEDYYDSEPEYSRVTYDSDNNCIKVYFKNDIKLASGAKLLNSVYLARNSSSFRSLSSDDVVRISPTNVVAITLSEPLSGTKNAVRIAAGTLADYDSGYVLNSTITTDYINAEDYYNSYDEDEDYTGTTSTGTSSYSGDVTTNLSDDFYTVTLKFNEPLLNNLSSLDLLKSKIQISRNGTFRALTSNDYIRVNDADNELVIVLAEPADEYFSQIRILSNSLRTSSGRVVSNSIMTLPLGESDGSARVYVDDKAFACDISTQLSSNNVIATFADEAQITSLNKSCKILVKLPEEMNSGTLNLSKNAVDSIKRYGGSFALSFGSATYYLPTSNIPELSDGDTLSIVINKTSGGVGSLATASGKDSFTIQMPAVNLNASVVKSTGEKTDITHSSFAEKRFMIKTPSGNATEFTAVRIEKSGNVVPVPSKTKEEAGVMYITAKTLADGDYAAISASHSFVNTPSWVSVPANTLGSRLILANINGSDLNASQAISRAETVTIMSKTLGIFADAKGASPFFDMIASDSYFNAVMSSVSHKLISGYPDGTFKPSGTLTRAEAMTIVARAMRFMNGKPASASADMTMAEATAILSKFTDASTVDTWAKVDIAECVAAGVVNGDNNGRLNPKANVTRAELIQLMYNVLNKAGMLSD